MGNLGYLNMREQLLERLEIPPTWHMPGKYYIHYMNDPTLLQCCPGKMPALLRNTEHWVFDLSLALAHKVPVFFNKLSCLLLLSVHLFKLLFKYPRTSKANWTLIHTCNYEEKRPNLLLAKQTWSAKWLFWGCTGQRMFLSTARIVPLPLYGVPQLFVDGTCGPWLSYIHYGKEQKF